MAMKPCKECKQEISSSAKKCPNCGKDQRNWFMKHKILTFIGAIILLGIIGSAMNGGKDNTATVNSGGSNGNSTAAVSSGDTAKTSTEPKATATVSSEMQQRQIVNQKLQQHQRKLHIQMGNIWLVKILRQDCIK